MSKSLGEIHKIISAFQKSELYKKNPFLSHVHDAEANLRRKLSENETKLLNFYMLTFINWIERDRENLVQFVFDYISLTEKSDF